MKEKRKWERRKKERKEGKERKQGSNGGKDDVGKETAEKENIRRDRRT